MAKVAVLTRLENSGLLKNGAMAAVAVEKTALAVMRLCFVAGTLVLTKGGLMRIEDIRPGMWVWSRDEVTGEMGWKRVVQCFTTHPNSIHHLTYEALKSSPSASAAVETLGVTAPHPFFVCNREQPGFVAAEHLKEGDALFLADGRQAVVTANTTEHAISGGTFTTYNFEVEDYHTYFVGNLAVWVHNAGGAPCERIFSTYFHYAKEAAKRGENIARRRFQTLLEAFNALRRENLPGLAWGKAAADVGRKMLKDYADNLFTAVGELPSYHKWKKNLFNGSVIGSDVQVHHVVEGYIQRLLGVDTRKKVMHDGEWVDLGDTVPGIPLPKDKATLDLMNGADPPEGFGLDMIHKGMDDGGISGILQSRIPTSGMKGGVLMSEQSIVLELHKIHVIDYPQFAKLWPAMRDHLRKLVATGEMQPWVIPN